eukprot:2498796-Rhodomonas_salina.1
MLWHTLKMLCCSERCCRAFRPRCFSSWGAIACLSAECQGSSAAVDAHTLVHTQHTYFISHRNTEIPPI